MLNTKKCYKVYYENVFLNFSISGDEIFANEQTEKFINRILRFEKFPYQKELFSLKEVTEGEYNE